MPFKKKATDNQLVEAYKRLGNVWKVGDELGMCGQSVHERLQKLSAIKDNHWTAREDEKLCEMYKLSNGNIELISKLIGRSYASIACRANELGITDIKRRTREETKIKIGNITKERLKTTPHPKGMKGKKHTDITKKVLSEKSKEMWQDPQNRLNSEAYRQEVSDRMVKVRSQMPVTNAYSRCKHGYYDVDGKKMFFRSSWEAMYANYLAQLLKMKIIAAWDYESTTFWFESIRRGVRSYTPDFRIAWQDGTVEYHEVKGWMDDKSKTKIKRMAKYYPMVKLIVIDQKQFTALKRQGWLHKIVIQEAQ
jgi:hypothetical protein